jgi:histidinol-phosphate aminotransferase
MAKSMAELVPAHIREILPYRPGKPVEEVERELKIRAVKLASNENPLGPSPKAVEAIQKYLLEANRYPDGGGFYLREALAARHDVPMEKVMLGLGSSELIDLAARVLLGPGKEGLTAQGTFALYPIAIRAAGARLVEVPLRNYAFDLEAMAAAITPATRVIYLANPNNPTGTYFDADALDRFLARVPEDVLVVLDEAYYDYVEVPNFSRAITRAKSGPNLLVLRTFSKVHGLAGLRVGYGIGPAELLVEMNKLRTPFNVPGLAQAAALAALGDSEHVRRSVESNRAGLAYLSARLKEMGATFVPSVANFLFVEVGDGSAVADELLKLGVIVRPMGWMGFPGAIRVSVGRAEENEKFVGAFAKLGAQAGRPTR